MPAKRSPCSGTPLVNSICFDQSSQAFVLVSSVHALFEQAPHGTTSHMPCNTKSQAALCSFTASAPTTHATPTTPRTVFFSPGPSLYSLTPPEGLKVPPQTGD